jgi:hypothetical protein
MNGRPPDQFATENGENVKKPAISGYTKDKLSMASPSGSSAFLSSTHHRALKQQGRLFQEPKAGRGCLGSPQWDKVNSQHYQGFTGRGKANPAQRWCMI